MRSKYPYPIASQLLIFFCVTCIQAVSFAQVSSFIEIANPEKIPENQELKDYEARLKQNTNLSGYYFVTLSPLIQSQEDGMLTFQIPGEEKPVMAEARQVKYQSETDYEWIGKTAEGRGTVVIISKKGRISASISTPEGVYEIFKAPGDLYCLQKIDMTDMVDVGCVMTSEKKDRRRIAINQPQQFASLGDTNAKLNPCQVPVNPRVLVLYSQKAFTLAGSLAVITDQANLSVAQFNSTIYNSGITGNAILNLAGVAPVDFSESENLGTDLEKLMVNISATTLRDQYQADLVVLFTDGVYSNGNTRGGAGTVTLDNNRAYAIVEIWSTTSRKTFAHEVGHLYGCRHDDTSGDPTYAKGYNVKNGLRIVTDRTLMVGKSVTENQAKNRLLNFSNPSIQVGGKATGTNNENNALRITQSHAIVSGFKPNANPPLASYIDGPTYVTSQGAKNYELIYSCGTGPYSISWQYSYDGMNYFTSNITTDIFTWHFYQTQKIWLKATVTASGQSVSAFIAITAQMPNPYKTDVFKSDSLNVESTSFHVTPNPSSGLVTITYYLNADANVKIEILYNSGREITVLRDYGPFQSKGLHSETWDSTGFTSGSYFARLTKDNIVEIRRILIVK